MSAGGQDVRPSAIAGTWYPGKPKELQATIQGFLDKVPRQALPGQLVGLIVPHAGYTYSGPVASYAYALLEGASFSRVVVVSPVHRMYPGRYAITRFAKYQTPLGLVPLDADAIADVASQIELSQVDQDYEHSLEIQLPFLQHVLGDFVLTPIMMGDQDLRSSIELGQALACAVAKRPALLVASTDLSHFHSHDVAQRLDQVVLDRIAAFDAEGLARVLERRQGEACGGGPVMAVMVAAKELGANQAVVLRHQDSGDVTGDRSNVVGYGAAALLRIPPPA